jgi:hypothetical protein
MCSRFSASFERLPGSIPAPFVHADYVENRIFVGRKYLLSDGGAGLAARAVRVALSVTNIRLKEEITCHLNDS